MSTYTALIEQLELRPIKCEKDLEASLLMAESLMLRLPELDENEQDYLQVLNDLIHTYESTAYGDLSQPGTPIEILKYLLEQNDLKQSDLAKLLGVTSSRAGELLSGVRDLTKTHVSILSKRFKVNAALFLPCADTLSVALSPTAPTMLNQIETDGLTTTK